jgi:hypothetical protein
MSSLRDKRDNTRGLLRKNEKSKQITTFGHIVQIDTRDCTGKDSLEQSRQAFYSEGGRGEAVSIITHTTHEGVYPITVITNTTETLKNGDIVTISGVQGNTVTNGDWKISNITLTSFEINTTGNGNYAGGGQWLRNADNGFPNINSTSCTIIGNEMIINLHKKLRAIRSISLISSIIPRDIIPIKSYYKDLYTESIGGDITFIPQEEKYMISNSFGFYSSSLSLFRSYDGKFSVPNQVTPPPYNLWNPPIGNWPSQPLPYRYQTVPTYRSANILIKGGIYHIICSGYGVYDLKDWTGSTRIETEKARKTLLKAIVRQQSYKNIDYLTIIDNCTTTSNDTSPYGYGNFQRFLCGPGLQLNYQPGTSDSANPSVPSGEWIVAFPNFLGNVWGPYGSPGDRFQKIGARDTIQDLFLNGDLDNLNGIPIINPKLTVAELMTSINYGINTEFETVTFSNINTTSNPNILNASRIVPNGFGAANVFAQGLGNPLYTNVYQSAGGIGPNNLGIPNSWSNTGVYGAASFTDPTAVGPLSWNLLTNGTIPQTTVSDLPPDNTGITHRISWFDMGPNNGMFMNNIRSYIKFALINLPSTNIVIQAFQFQRSTFVQSTNSEVSTSIFNIPIRLSPGSVNGGIEYVENLFALLSQVSDFEYWGQHFLSPIASLDKISLKFNTYEGDAIPLEKMLSLDQKNYNDTSSKIRTSKSISLMFRIECYQYVNVGLIDIVEKILGTEEEEEEYSFNIKASNYDNYS